MIEISFRITQFSDKSYMLEVDNETVLEDIKDFMLIDKEIRKYERLRFKEYVK